MFLLAAAALGLATTLSATNAAADIQKTVKTISGSVQNDRPTNLPRVVVPTGARPNTPARPVAPSVRGRYPWRMNIVVTVFWIGELPGPNNPTPNNKSSWDGKWQANFGGYDNPDPTARIASHATNDFRPKAFIPKLNPFYIALPYNDIAGWGRHKAEASRVIPWFARMNPQPGQTVLKGRWIEMWDGRRSCFAQWEDCGPWVTDDWEYVFNGKKPRNSRNSGAALDISPAIRDYLGLASGRRVHWRFVEDAEVPHGPWKKYAQPRTGAPMPFTPTNPPPDDADNETVRRYLEYLRQKRDEEYLKQPMRRSGP